MPGDTAQHTATPSRAMAMSAALMAIFTTIFASNLPTPLYSVWQARWGFSSAALTGVFSIYVLGVVSTLLTLGALSDKLGRRQMMVPGLLFILAGGVAFLLADGIVGLGVARVLTGVGTGIVTGAASAALVELEPNGNWTRAATLSALFFTLGAFAGPTVSSLALRFGPGADIWPFFVVILLSAGSIMLMLTAPWPAGVGQRMEGFSLRAWRPTTVKVPRELLGAFIFCAAAICLAWSTGSLYASLGPSLARYLVGIDDRAIAGLFAAAWQLAAGMTQFACQRQPVNRLLIAGPSMLIFGLMAMAGAVLTSSPWLFALATLGTAVGAGCTGVVAVASISNVAPPGERGSIISAFYLMAYLTMATVVLSVGFVSDQLGFGTTVLGFTVLISIAAASLMAVAIHSKRAWIW
ncbi:Predicted arabinose efflux permease, MFS family [Halopseudomonas xinjiangensis]|uniref:Predicted arabinose efflux permease, MFS family n=1 Tax=Halopseudomonas xinjiangensis TaxID=487184 RepID=A0A1H1UPX3_9GAMM|nr:MFS transporter [Halopseudomonas xinjiangensis]SDS74330.1 Predicted arabinose efflux permease, MFS family [Halopseudomonas xinjiangensis]